ncbi:hypothetical protein EJB05_28908 [Eragrostis curvula]|uniref:Uncharacterized protein n=1 Tax=Eragrostis curvula TaxID=38414 RepID=A0A5J9US54_9POAL|nr:hypothetical protein EJB05_28908 [Eragrostis curvula]
MEDFLHCRAWGEAKLLASVDPSRWLLQHGKAGLSCCCTVALNSGHLKDTARGEENQHLKGVKKVYYAPTEMSEHLKIATVECAEVDERILQILKFFITIDIEATVRFTPAKSEKA